MDEGWAIGVPAVAIVVGLAIGTFGFELNEWRKIRQRRRGGDRSKRR